MGEMGAGEWETQASRYGMNNQVDGRHNEGNMVNGIVIVSLVTHGSYTCGEYRIR